MITPTQIGALTEELRQSHNNQNIQDYHMDTELFTKYKNSQREGWASFAPLELVTATVAPALVKFSRLQPRNTVLDVGCGTGVVAITAAREGAIASAVDFCPQLIIKAVTNKKIAKVEVDFKEGDVEKLPYENESFDIVLSQFGHMFAPNAKLAIDEMLRVLKPGGTIAFSTWPPEHYVGKLFNLTSKYSPTPLQIDIPCQWGSPEFVTDKLGNRVTDLMFDYDIMHIPALSVEHYCKAIEKTLGPIVNFIERVGEEAIELTQFRLELYELAANYFKDNKMHQTFLMTRAKKVPYVL